jgi:hypothetical protein
MNYARWIVLTLYAFGLAALFVTLRFFTDYSLTDVGILLITLFLENGLIGIYAFYKCVVNIPSRSKNVPVDFEEESISVRKAKAILDANDIHEDRAQALAAIFKHDMEAYGDVNMKTVLRAMEIAKIVE